MRKLTVAVRALVVDQVHDAMNSDQAEALIDYLGQFLTPERKAKIETVLAYRTRYVTVVLEDIHTSQNAGAVLRNCDNFGTRQCLVPHSFLSISLPIGA